MGFTGDTILKRKSKYIYELLSTLTYENEHYKISALPSFETDGASIPRFLWSLIGCPFSGKYVGSAIIHDVLFVTGVLSEKEMNNLFYEMLGDNNVGYIRRNIMYYSVRLYSKMYYKRKLYLDKKDLSFIKLLYKN